MTKSQGPFAHVAAYAGDPILTLNEVFEQDPRAGKMNLGIGVYLDERGQLPVMAAVRAAEERIFEKGGAKPYLPMGGSADFRRLAQELVFGTSSIALRERRVATIAVRTRIADMRVKLRRALESMVPGRDFSYITRQRGMFSFTGLSTSQVDDLRERSAIYMLWSGRACMTGVTPSNLSQVASALAETFRH